jgi:hypothetical protein
VVERNSVLGEREPHGAIEDAYAYETSPRPRSSGRDARPRPAPDVKRARRPACRSGRARLPGSSHPRRNAKARSAIPPLL